MRTTMNLPPGGPAPSLRRDAGKDRAAEPLQLEAFIEASLGALEGSFLSFACLPDPVDRSSIRDGWRTALTEILEDAFLVDPDREGLLQPAFEGQKLALREGIQVFGFLDRQQVGDCYYLYDSQNGAPVFYTVCIESGMAEGGPYGIHVTPAQDWHAFRAGLPAS